MRGSGGSPNSGNLDLLMSQLYSPHPQTHLHLPLNSDHDLLCPSANQQVSCLPQNVGQRCHTQLGNQSHTPGRKGLLAAPAWAWAVETCQAAQPVGALPFRPCCPLCVPQPPVTSPLLSDAAVPPAPLRGSLDTAIGRGKADEKEEKQLPLPYTLKSSPNAGWYIHVHIYICLCMCVLACMGLCGHAYV